MTHVQEASDHLDHRFLRRRHHLGQEDLEQIFFRERVNAVYIEGDAFHRYDRAEMRTQMAKEAERGNKHFSHFSPETNLFEELERAFRDYGETGTAVTRHYIHDTEESALHGAPPGTFTEWERLPENSTFCSMRACTVPWSPTRSTSRAMPT